MSASSTAMRIGVCGGEGWEGGGEVPICKGRKDFIGGGIYKESIGRVTTPLIRILRM